MYYTLGFKPNIQNCIKLISTREIGKFTSVIEFKKALGRYLDEVQSLNKISTAIEELPVRVSRMEEKYILAKSFSVRSQLNDLDQASMIEDLNVEGEEFYQQRVYSAIRLIDSQNPELAALIKIVFRYLLFGTSSKAHGGSTSNALGVLWMNPSLKWTMQDYCEFLVHEVTHQLLFLDERVYGHYSDYPAISRKENFAFSTILKKRRPLDKVIHSYFVGQNILRYRQIHWNQPKTSYHLHPNDKALSKGLEDTRSSLKQSHWALTTARTNDLFNVNFLSHLKSRTNQSKNRVVCV